MTHHYLRADKATRREIKKLLAVFLLDTATIDCPNAINLPVADYEDAILSETAHRCSIDYIVTRNTGDFRESPVPALTPIEFLNTQNIIDIAA